MKRLIQILAAVLLLGGSAWADIITATITVTNTAGTVNGNTLTVNSDVRTWSTTVTIPGSQILINGTIGGSATNMFNAISVTPFSPVLFLGRTGTNGITLTTQVGGALAVTLSAGWGNVVLTTNTTVPVVPYAVPYASQVAGQQTNMVSDVVAAVGSTKNTNTVPEAALSLANFVGLTLAQTISGAKLFSSITGQWYGMVSNSPAISGNVDTLTNGVWRGGSLSSPFTTNLVNKGNAISSPGAGVFSEQFGSGAIASGAGAAALGRSSSATGASSLAAGNGSLASGDNDVALGTGAAATGGNSTGVGAGATVSHANSIALGYLATTTAANQVMVGTATLYTHIPGNLRVDGNTEITFKRFAVTSLANGNNAGVVVGTNTFIEVSGPSAAFTINGIAGGRDGKEIKILNYTGFNMTIAYDSGTDPTAGNRIYTPTGADVSTTGNGFCQLIYDASRSRWQLEYLTP